MNRWGVLSVREAEDERRSAEVSDEHGIGRRKIEEEEKKNERNMKEEEKKRKGRKKK